MTIDAIMRRHLMRKKASGSIIELIKEKTELQGKLKESMEREAALEAKMARVAAAMKDVGQFTCPVNAVTAPHRHGNPVPGKRMTDLCNRQIDFEETLEEIHAILSESRPALAVVEGYSLDGCFPDDVFMDGRMQIYEEQTDEQEMLYTVVVLERKEP